MKIAVIGAGAMGAMTGGKLTRSEQDVTLVDVWKEHVDVMNKQGLLLKTKGDEGTRIPVRAVYHADEIAEPVDLVVVFVKGTFTATAIKAALSIIGADTYVLTLQNGVGNADVIAEFVAADHILIGTTTASATLLKPGEVNDTTEVVEGKYTAHITSYVNQNTERVKEIAQVFTNAGITTEVSEDAEVAIWEKLAVNCCVNAPCMLTRLNCGIFSNDPEGAYLQEKMIREIVSVAQIKGIPLNYRKIKNNIQSVFKSSTHHPSMSQDGYKKARTEIETITGAVVREGKKYDISTPINEAMYHLVKVVENNYDKIWY